MGRGERTRKLKSFWSVFIQTIKEYTRKTSVHGVRYITEEQFTTIERVGWVLVLVLSSALCCVFISHSVAKWIRSPVIVSFATKTSPITEVDMQVEYISKRNLIKHHFDFILRFRFPPLPSAQERHSVEIY